MKKNYSSIFAVLFFLLTTGFIYFTMMPQMTSEEEGPLAEFSTARAFKQVENIARQPHYVGSLNHDQVANYLQKELRNLGLETTIQEGYTLTDWGNLVKSKNIIARIKGSANSKALLLLSHYDSAPHSFSRGASDAGSGVATILESVRAFIYDKQKHKNDIIILFSDAEELGLNGAALFVTQHQWAKEIGLVLNFEARGSSGPSYMLMETNNGNAALVKEFAAAKAIFPVSNSLMYSIYKMLPNDTDLTVFREKGGIQGYNFAFIDGHYNYHTAQDDPAHLAKNTLEHQGSYLMPLLRYFSNTDLRAIETQEDNVYFTAPFTFINYPFSWVFPMVIVAGLLFLILVFIGIGKRILCIPEIMKGFIPLLGSLLSAGLVTFLGWQLLLLVYPQYNDLLNGFTYNGHSYIAAFVLLAIAISFGFYHLFSIKKLTMNHYIAPLFIWIIINATIAISLPGAGFLILPLYFGLLALAVFVITQKSYKFLNLVLSIPAFIIIAPFIQMFPIGLGLKILYGSAILTVLTFTLLLPTFGSFVKKGKWGFVFLLASIGFFAHAHYESGYEKGKAKSNSLLYVYDAESKVAKWVTYDKNLDSWTKSYLGENPKAPQKLNATPLFSKYNSKFTYATTADLRELPLPTIQFLRDSTAGNQRYLKIRISPNRKVNRYDIFANEKMTITNFKANGAQNLEQKGASLPRRGLKIVSYYVVANEPLEMEFSIDRSNVFDMQLLESSFDLMQNLLFSMQKREDWMMPTPFILNDAVVIKQRIKPSPPIVLEPQVIPTMQPKKASRIIKVDSLKVE
tara:strand:- start:1686 stop:4076 length:2391 start_codon:yes stop_codon:yes gene_type:complete